MTTTGSRPPAPKVDIRPRPDHPFIHAALKDEDILEHAMRDIYTRLLGGEGACAAIDGGAHGGMHTEFLSAVPSCRHIYAVEANPAKASELARTAPRYGGDRVEVVAAALQQDPARSEIAFMLSTSHSGRSGISSIFQFDPDVAFETITVPATTIDRMTADRVLPVRFIKLDLEGGEFNALRGGETLLREDRPVIAMENSVYAPQLGGYTLEEYFDTFLRFGYRPITFLGETMTAENMFDLWYAWAAPEERAEEIASAIAARIA